MSNQILCCGKNAVWVRSTQFAGNHYFCDSCAKKEENFGEEDSSYFWYEIEENHPTELKNNKLEEIALEVAKLRYDRIADFIEVLQKDIAQQSIDDLKAGHPQLAALLNASSEALLAATKTMHRAWTISKPHMK